MADCNEGVMDFVTRIYCPECGYYEMAVAEDNPASSNEIAITCKRCGIGPYTAVRGRSVYEMGGIKVILKARGEQMIELSLFPASMSYGKPLYWLLWSISLPVSMDSNYQPAMRIGMLCRSVIRAAIREGLIDHKVAVNVDSALAIVKGQAYTELDDFGEEYCELVMIAGDDELCLERYNIKEKL